MTGSPFEHPPKIGSEHNVNKTGFLINGLHLNNLCAGICQIVYLMTFYLRFYCVCL